MTEAARGRRLHVENRLAELNARLEPLEPQEPESTLLDPSWGMLGNLVQLSLADRLIDADMRRLERARKFSDGEPETSRKLENTSPKLDNSSGHAASW